MREMGFVDDPSDLPEEFICLVCLSPMTRAFNLSPCNHKLCEPCVGQLQAAATRRQQWKCPVCRAAVASSSKDHAFCNIVDQAVAREARMVKCTGCNVRLDKDACDGHRCQVNAAVAGSGSSSRTPKGAKGKKKKGASAATSPKSAATIHVFSPDLCVSEEFLPARVREGKPTSNLFVAGLNLVGNIAGAGLSLLARAAVLSALSNDPTDVDAWYAMSQYLVEGQTVLIRGANVTKRDCLARSIPQLASNSTPEKVQTIALRWYTLGTMLSPSESVRTCRSDVLVTVFDCFVHAIEIATKAGVQVNPKAWLKVALLLPADGSATVMVNGVKYTAEECYKEALCLDDDLSTAWNNVGAFAQSKWNTAATTALRQGVDPPPMATAVVGSASYTPLQCFRSAVERDSMNYVAWGNLREALRGCNDDDAVYVNGRRCGAKHICLKLVELQPQLGSTWLALFQEMKRGESVIVNGQRKTWSDCRKMAGTRRSEATDNTSKY